MLLLLGFLISFIGQLPLGVINLLVVDISLKQSKQSAIKFSGGIVLIEALYLTLILLAVNWLNQFKQVVTAISIVTIVSFIVLGVYTLKNKPTRPSKTAKSGNTLVQYSFVYGLIIGILNVVQIPFWLLWSSYLINSAFWHYRSIDYILLLVGSVLGTFICLYVYIFLGKQITAKWPIVQRKLHLMIALFFFIAAITQFIYLINNH